jgi:ATP-binding cassette, subfamily B, bacterial
MGRAQALRTLLGMAWRADRSATALVFALIAGQVLADGAVSLSLRWIVDGAVAGRVTEAVVAGLVGGLALAIAQVGGRIAANLQMDLGEQVRLLLDRDVLTMTASLDGLEHLERSDHLDRIMLVRQQSRALAGFGWSALGFVSITLQVLVSVWLLVTVTPVLLPLAALFALPLLLARVGRRRVQRALTETTTAARLEKHLHGLCTKAAPGKEVRIAGCGPELDRRAAALWQEATGAQVAARRHAAVLGVVGWLVFSLAFAGALLVVSGLVLDGRGTPGDLVLVVSVVAQFRNQTNGLAAIIGEFVTGMAVLGEYTWLRGYAAARQRPATAEVPARLDHGIDLEGLAFGYPASDVPVLHDVTAHLPAGSVVALVGEHGAGKTTLVKLLCGFYQPTAGTILVDGVPLSDVQPAAWRERTSAAFQDFGRFEFLARENVGAGDLPRIDDEPAVLTAVGRAHAGDVLTALPAGLSTQLGRTFAGGVDVSGGQWQKLALSRAFMRDAPLLLVLDEPTASLDAAAEQALFELYADRARELGRANGTITVLVSHRFSTVRMADLILVLDGGTIVQRGHHDELVRAGGLYADLYALQAAAYRSSE